MSKAYDVLMVEVGNMSKRQTTAMWDYIDEIRGEKAALAARCDARGEQIEIHKARIRDLEAALLEDRADFDAINALESVYRIDKVLGTAPETGVEPK